MRVLAAQAHTLLLQGAAPKRLYVEGDLAFSPVKDSRALIMPHTLDVQGGLNLDRQHHLTQIADTLIVRGPCILHSNHGLRRLARRVEVHGTLFVSNALALTELAERLIVRGELYIRRCHALRQLPPDAQLGGRVRLYDCHALTHLPDDLHVRRSLYLTSCLALERLPRGLSASRLLAINNLPAIKELPPDVKLSGNLALLNCEQLQRLPSPLRLNRELHVQNCVNLREVPRRVRVSQKVRLLFCPNISTLPADLRTPELDLNGTPITFVPHGVEKILQGGIPLEHRHINTPESISAAEVLGEANAERRRILLQRLGAERFMRDAKPEVVDQDIERSGKPRQLLRVELPELRNRWSNRPINEEPLVMLSVICPSTDRAYLLRVPPTMRTCAQAAAWIAGFDDPNDYRPIRET
jgi:hypothetical protein